MPRTRMMKPWICHEQRDEPIMAMGKWMARDNEGTAANLQLPHMTSQIFKDLQIWRCILNSQFNLLAAGGEGGALTKCTASRTHCAKLSSESSVKARPMETRTEAESNPSPTVPSWRATGRRARVETGGAYYRQEQVIVHGRPLRQGTRR